MLICLHKLLYVSKFATVKSSSYSFEKPKQTPKGVYTIYFAVDGTYTIIILFIILKLQHHLWGKFNGNKMYMYVL